MSVVPAKSIFITGAARGIGRAVAEHFAARGWFVGLFDLDGPGACSLAQSLGEAHACAGRLDVTDEDSVRQALADFERRTEGRMDVLFNCAGVLSVGDFATLDFARHAAHCRVNFEGLMRVCHMAYPALSRTPGARVINMSSASADYGSPDFASYSASKFAVRGLTEALNLEWRGAGIHVCDIMPPFVRTPMLDGLGDEVTSLRRMGVNLEPEAVAATVWSAATGRRKLHWPVGVQYKLLYYTWLVFPTWLRRLIVRSISGR